MNHKHSQHRELLSIEEANAMLPLVRAIVADFAQLSAELIDRRKRLAFLLAGRNPNDHDLYQEELVQIEQELEKDTRRLHDYREELRALGVESENASNGYVHFPAMLDGRKISLCWKLGETEVLFWHDSDIACSKRHFLTVESVMGGISEDTLEG
jgi:hypothetical protein